MGKKLKEDEKIKTNIPDSPFEDKKEKDEEEDIEEMMGMDYKTMMGFSKKQQTEKVVREHKPSIVDNLKEEFGGKLNEGPKRKYDYSKFAKKIQKSRNQFASDIVEFSKVLKNTGLNEEAEELLDFYQNHKTTIINLKYDFDKLIKKMDKVSGVR